jgi:hypothetical protein
MTTPLPSPKEQRRHFGKLLLRILLPLMVIGVLACLGLDMLVKKYLIDQTPSHGAAKLYRIQESQPGEIPILGSSRALCTFIPDSIGPHYFNYGINGIGFAVMDIFLKRALARPDTTPILLNFDYGMFFYQMGDINSYLPHTNLPEVRPLLRKSGQYGFQMEIPGIRYYGSMDAFMKDRLNEKLQLTKAANRGAAIDKAPFDSSYFALMVQQRRDSVQHWDPSQELIDTLFERIHTHRDREFVIVVAPYHKVFYEAMDPKSLQRGAIFLDWLDAEPNVRVVQWDTWEWPDRYFLNTSHVNLEGAQYTSKLLKEALAHPPAISPNDSAAKYHPVPQPQNF